MIHYDARKSFIKYKATTKYFVKKEYCQEDTNAKLHKDPALQPDFCLLFVFQKCFAQSAMVAEIPLTLLSQKFHSFLSHKIREKKTQRWSCEFLYSHPIDHPLDRSWQAITNCCPTSGSSGNWDVTFSFYVAHTLVQKQKRPHTHQRQGYGRAGALPARPACFLALPGHPGNSEDRLSSSRKRLK